MLTLTDSRTSRYEGAASSRQEKHLQIPEPDRMYLLLSEHHSAILMFLRYPLENECSQRTRPLAEQSISE